MTFRARLLASFTVATLVPLVLLAVGVRRQIASRLTAQHERRVEALARVAMQDLVHESASIDRRLRSLAGALADDNRFRLAVSGSPAERAYLLDWAEGAMRVTGLSMLQLQDDGGRILSSGQFRNEFDRLDPALPRLLAAAADSVALVAVRAPDERFLAIGRVDSLFVGGRRFTLAGGVAADSALLGRFAHDEELSISLAVPDDTLAADGADVAARLPLAWIDTRAGDRAAAGPAALVVRQSRTALDLLLRDVNRWFLAALAAAVAGALALAAWLSASLSRPIAALARATSAIDLEGPQVELATAGGRDDEIGALARRFGAMTRRLRASAVRLRDAERRATVGEMARQVNHDIKNGLIPIRNVVRHLVEVQEQRPDELPGVFAERRSTLESSIGYLDTLARSYARLTPRTDRRAFDANAVAREAARAAAGGEGIAIETRLADALPDVLGDPLVFRRIVDNLLRNALESIAPPPLAGAVTLETSRVGDAVRIVVADTGRGMSGEELDRAFDDFFTTKPGGTGLGLSVVRRLTADLQGTLRVTSEPGRGTTFIIELPSAHAHSPARATARDQGRTSSPSPSPAPQREPRE